MWKKCISLAHLFIPFPVVIANFIRQYIYIKQMNMYFWVVQSIKSHFVAITHNCMTYPKLYLYMHAIYVGTRTLTTKEPHPVLTRRLCDVRRRRSDVTTPRLSQNMSCRWDNIASMPREPLVGYNGIFVMYCLPVLSSSCRKRNAS